MGGLRNRPLHRKLLFLFLLFLFFFRPHKALCAELAAELLLQLLGNSHFAAISLNELSQLSFPESHAQRFILKTLNEQVCKTRIDGFTNSSELRVQKLHVLHQL